MIIWISCNNPSFFISSYIMVRLILVAISQCAQIFKAFMRVPRRIYFCVHLYSACIHDPWPLAPNIFLCGTGKGWSPFHTATNNARVVCPVYQRCTMEAKVAKVVYSSGLGIAPVARAQRCLLLLPLIPSVTLSPPQKDIREENFFPRIPPPSLPSNMNCRPMSFEGNWDFLGG